VGDGVSKHIQTVLHLLRLSTTKYFAINPVFNTTLTVLLPRLQPFSMDQDYIQRIRDTFETQERTHEPWTSGVIDLAARNSVLFFSCKDGSARQVV
jgi:hypothetical protein